MVVSQQITQIIKYTICVVPFITAISISPLFPVITDDPRFAREFICLSVAMLIIALAIKNKIAFSTDNKWFLFFLFYIIFGIGYAPNFYLQYSRYAGNVANFWIYISLVYTLIYSFLFLVVINIKFERQNIIQCLQWLSIAGMVMSMYLILQAVGLDQFAILRKMPDGWGGDSVNWHTAAAMTGTLGNPTIVSAWMVPIVPLAFLCSRALCGLAMIAAIIITKSQVSIFALAFIVLVVVFLFLGRNVAWVWRASVFLNILFILGVLLFRFDLINDNNRFNIWKQALADWRGGVVTQPIPEDWPQIAKDITEEQNKRKYPITGVGFGSFRYVFTQKHDNPWVQAHNEPLEILWGLGIVGFLLTTMMVFKFIKSAMPSIKKDPVCAGLFLSFSAYVVLTLGNFVLQIEPHRFTFVVLTALMINRSWIKEDVFYEF
jgi:hypothetical protein